MQVQGTYHLAAFWLTPLWWPNDKQIKLAQAFVNQFKDRTVPNLNF